MGGQEFLPRSRRDSFRLGAVLLLVLLALPAALPARDLVGVFEDALHSDPLIRQADANRLAARESRPQALSALLPQLNGTATVTREHTSGNQDQITFVPQPVVLPFPITTDTTTRAWNLNLRQNVFSWANWMTLKAADSQVAQAEVNYQAAQQDLILRVARAYFNVLTADDSLDANQASLEAISRQLDQANKRFDVGLIAITDVQEAKAARDSAAAAVIAAKRTRATSEDQLQEITGQKYDGLSKPGSDMPLQNPAPADEDRWVQVSLDQNLALIGSRLAADIARDNVRTAIGGHLPTLDLVAGRGYTHGVADQVYGGDHFAGVSDKFNDRQIGLQLSVPIFSGGYTQSRVRESEYRWRAAKEAVVHSSRATERQARDAYLGVISGIARVQALSQALESSRTALKATEAGYEVGTRTAVDVLNARKTLVQASTDLSVSRYDYLISTLQLRLAAGTLDRRQLGEINGWLTATAPGSPLLQTPQSLQPTVPEPPSRQP